jgi:hypothetical protein
MTKYPPGIVLFFAIVLTERRFEFFLFILQLSRTNCKSFPFSFFHTTSVRSFILFENLLNKESLSNVYFPLYF